MNSSRQIVFRVDSSVEIGSGHLMRCLTLADELKNQGNQVAFICRDFEGNLSSLLLAKRHNVFLLPRPSGNQNYDKSGPYASWLGVTRENDALETLNIIKRLGSIDYLVVDHYALDIDWEKRVRKSVKRILVIDDLADRAHDCDCLLDQSYFDDMDSRYQGLVPYHCRQLLGYDYVLLRPEFRELRTRNKKRSERVNRLLVFFGGSDPGNDTYKVVQAITSLNKPDIEVDVVVGQSNPFQGQIIDLCSRYENINFYCQISNFAELMEAADLSIGGGGFTAYERCCLGLPSIVVPIIESQIRPMKGLADKEAIDLMTGERTIEGYINKICQYINGEKALQHRSEIGKTLFDGWGVQRVINEMETLV